MSVLEVTECGIRALRRVGSLACCAIDPRDVVLAVAHAVVDILGIGKGSVVSWPSHAVVIDHAIWGVLPILCRIVWAPENAQTGAGKPVETINSRTRC